MKRILLAALGAGLLLSACSPSVTVRSDYARGVNFRQFNSFTVEADRGRNPDPVMGSELNQTRITKALEAELVARGLSNASDRKADLIVRFGTDSRDRQSTQSNNSFSPFAGWYGGGQNISTRNYEENRIVINVYDTRTNQQVWQGWASGQFYDRNKDVEGAIYQSVNKIMARFPVQASPEFARER